MATGFSTTVRNSRLTQIVNAIDGGSGAGTIKFYTGTRPATGGAITSQTLLGTLTFSDPCGTVSGGVLTFSTITGDPAPTPMARPLRDGLPTRPVRSSPMSGWASPGRAPRSS